MYVFRHYDTMRIAYVTYAIMLTGTSLIYARNHNRTLDGDGYFAHLCYTTLKSVQFSVVTDAQQLRRPKFFPHCAVTGFSNVTFTFHIIWRPHYWCMLPLVPYTWWWIANVKTRAAKNNLQLNCSKSLEIVFRSRRIRGKSEHPAPPSNWHWASWQADIFGVLDSLQPTTSALNSPPVQAWCMPYVCYVVMVSQRNRWKTCFKQRWLESHCTVRVRGVAFVQLLTVYDVTRFYVVAIKYAIYMEKH